MKQFSTLLALGLLMLLLCSCSVMGNQTLVIHGKEAQLLPDEDAIIYGGDRYHYSAGARTISITYPNGYVYTHSESGSSWSCPSDAPAFSSAQELGYLPEDLLVAFIQKGDPTQSETAVSPVISILLIVLGLLCAVFPQIAWHLSSRGRRSEEAPSTLTLRTQRIGGVLLILAGLFTLLR